jgi:hypothetical protein
MTTPILIITFSIGLAGIIYAHILNKKQFKEDEE